MSPSLLLFSNSTNKGEEFLAYAKPVIREFLGDEPCRILFLPFAAVGFPYEEYALKVKEQLAPLGYTILNGGEEANLPGYLESADAIMTGGGNTFVLTEHLHRLGLITKVREKVLRGTPYIGWSAGANAACPTLKTTNDMPIVDPPSFTLFDLVSFQINPHYTEAAYPNHNGETRPKRLQEFLALNRQVVIALPEGTWLEVEGDTVTFQGREKGKLYTIDSVTEIAPGSVLDY